MAGIIVERVRWIIARELEVDPGKVTLDATLRGNLLNAKFLTRTSSNCQPQKANAVVEYM